MPESNVAAANALLKNTAARDQQQRRRADLQANQEISRPSWPRVPDHFAPDRPDRFDARRLQRGDEPEKHRRDAGANDEKQQHAPVRVGTDNRRSPRSAAQLVITAEMIASSATREIAKPTAAATSASSRLSVNSWRMMRRRVAPSDSRMPISRCRATALARSRLATLAQPISRMRPNAKNKGATTDSASRGCGIVPRLGTSVMFEGPRSIGLPARLAVHPRRRVPRVPSARDMPGFRRPTMSRLASPKPREGGPTFASRPDRSGEDAEHRERRPVVVRCDGQSAKFLGHYADDLEREPTDEQAATENGRVARKQPIPSAVTEDHHRLSRGRLVVGRRQRASHRGADADAPGRSCP